MERPCDLSTREEVGATIEQQVLKKKTTPLWLRRAGVSEENVRQLKINLHDANARRQSVSNGGELCSLSGENHEQ